jgi:hypothetical protein
VGIGDPREMQAHSGPFHGDSRGDDTVLKVFEDVVLEVFTAT